MPLMPLIKGVVLWYTQPRRTASPMVVDGRNLFILNFNWWRLKDIGDHGRCQGTSYNLRSIHTLKIISLEILHKNRNL